MQPATPETGQETDMQSNTFRRLFPLAATAVAAMLVSGAALAQEVVKIGGNRRQFTAIDIGEKVGRVGELVTLKRQSWRSQDA